MYSQRTKNWIKHIDFILLDVLCLQFAFVLAYITRHGISNPYGEPLYRNIAIVYILVDFTVLIMNGTMKNVLKRGFYKEVRQTLRHVLLVAAILLLLLFSAQYGEDYSRITFYLTTLYYLIVSYSIRLIWKTVLRQQKKSALTAAAYFVTTSERVEQVLSVFRKNSMDRFKIQGICLLDRDAVGQEIQGIPITATREDLLEYLCDKWVDEIFVSIPVGAEYPGDLINSITEMGIVVHISVEQMHVEDWQHQVIEKIAGSTVRTLSMTMATPQEQFWKRALDILGGILGCIITLLLVLVVGPLIYIKSGGNGPVPSVYR